VRKWRIPVKRAVVAAFVLVLASYGAVSFRVADALTKPTRHPLDPPAASVAATYEEVSFRSTDGLLLKGWWFPVASADRAVVLVHGRSANRIKSGFNPQKVAQFLLANRYSVLLFDLRAHGESEGVRYSLGQYEPRDVIAAIDFAQRKAGIDRKRVAIIGESMGGGSAIMTVKVDPTIGPVIADSAFADGITVVDEVGQNYTGLPSWFTPGIVLMARVFLDLDLASIKPADVVRRSSRARVALHPMRGRRDRVPPPRRRAQGREHEPRHAALARAGLRPRAGVRDADDRVAAARPRIPGPRDPLSAFDGGADGR
jgi:pimeloyl-ACP methyl ester carboxylesterase